VNRSEAKKRVATRTTYTRGVALVRIAVVVVLVVSGLVVLYGLILDRSGQNIAFTVAGLAVLGLTLAFISAWFLSRALTDARWGRSSGALTGAIMGGLFAVAAAGCLAIASVFTFIRV
jgi:hypothetical protein